jgi:hypothetical protein
MLFLIYSTMKHSLAASGNGGQQPHPPLGWAPDGSAFVVYDPVRTCIEIVPFRGLGNETTDPLHRESIPVKFQSLTRKLYRWGFRQFQYRTNCSEQCRIPNKLGQRCPMLDRIDHVVSPFSETEALPLRPSTCETRTAFRHPLFLRDQAMLIYGIKKKSSRPVVHSTSSVSATAHKAKTSPSRTASEKASKRSRAETNERNSEKAPARSFSEKRQVSSVEVEDTANTTATMHDPNLRGTESHLDGALLRKPFASEPAADGSSRSPGMDSSQRTAAGRGIDIVGTHAASAHSASGGATLRTRSGSLGELHLSESSAFARSRKPVGEETAGDVNGIMTQIWRNQLRYRELIQMEESRRLQYRLALHRRTQSALSAPMSLTSGLTAGYNVQFPLGASIATPHAYGASSFFPLTSTSSLAALSSLQLQQSPQQAMANLANPLQSPLGLSLAPAPPILLVAPPASSLQLPIADSGLLSSRPQSDNPNQPTRPPS